MKGVKEQTLPDGCIMKAVRNSSCKSDLIAKKQKNKKNPKKPQTNKQKASSHINRTLTLKILKAQSP